MLESKVESTLKRLEKYGFSVLKLRTPGFSGVMDRMILAPHWSPCPAVFVELKAPGKSERALQEAVREDWVKRGCDVRPMCDTVEKANALVDVLLIEAVEGHKRTLCKLPVHIIKDYLAALTEAARR
jgi:hypothetical protein